MKTGVLLIHGFTGGPYEVQPLADYFADKTDWIISVPTLPGHGETLELKQVTADDWMMKAELALRELKKQADRVFVVGFSMGGLIAIYLALRYNVERLVLLSAAAKYVSPVQLAKEMAEMMKDAASGRLTLNERFESYKYKLAHTPVSATAQFLRVVKLVSPYYRRISIPVCLVQGGRDGIVPAAAAEFLMEELGSEEKVLIRSENSRHLICYSEDCQDWFSKVHSFLTE